MLAAQILNLQPAPTPPPPDPVDPPAPKKKRTGGGGVPESNLYDPAESDPNHPYYDNEGIAEDELVALAQQAQQLANALADVVTVEVNALDTRVVIDSNQLVASSTGDALGQLDNATAETSPLSVSVDVFDVIVTGDNGDDE